MYTFSVINSKIIRKDMEFTAKQLAQVLKGTVEGDPQVKVTSFAKIEHGKPGQLCFYANPKYEKYVYTCKASILLVNKDFEAREAVTCGPPQVRRHPEAHGPQAQGFPLLMVPYQQIREESLPRKPFICRASRQDRRLHEDIRECLCR